MRLSPRPPWLSLTPSDHREGRQRSTSGLFHRRRHEIAHLNVDPELPDVIRAIAERD
jgi:hypothetical protein